MTGLVDINNMKKTYVMGSNMVRALDGVDLNIKHGEYISIVGPSGSGKSTLMNMIGCLDAPDSGSYMLDGVDVSDMNDKELAEIRSEKIGFVFQGFNLLPRLTALENVELPLIYRGYSHKKRREMALEALDRVGLGDRVHHKPTELSGGQMQRVAVARALAGNPPVLLADEPTGNLDTNTGKEILAMLEKIHDQGNTIILITHDKELAGQAKRRIEIRDGRIIHDEEVRK
ncbi:MAG: ABC transporter ATP-binding protein [Clostridia bacterium]|nr:ABC transporter ATP-binding protein [Clostridia bacterium]MBN2883750.1 ABC transporter ATP-binding protein [Clostridia bacterium]